MSHRVNHKWISRVEDGERVRYEEGDTFEPTDAELSAYGDRLDPVEEGASENGAEERESETEESEAQVSESETESTEEAQEENEGGSGESVDLESMSYTELQSLAGEYDDVQGNLPKDELRSALKEKV